MLHILLFILKIIGIIIAAILGILVLLVCVVLFVPGRYDIEASCNGSPSEIQAAARVTWFLNLVRFNMCYEKKKMTWRLSIAWKSRQGGQEDKKKIKKEVETYDEEMEELWEDLEESGKEEPEKNEKVVGTSKETGESENLKQISEEAGKGGQMGRIPEKVGKDEEDKPERSSKILEEVSEESKEGNGKSEKDAEKLSESRKSSEEQTNTGKNLEEQTGIGKDMEEAETGVGKGMEETETGAGKGMEEDEQGSEEGRKRIWQKATGGCREIIRKIADLYRKITGIPGRIGEIFQSFSHRIRTLSEKKNKILDFISDEVHKKAFVKVKDESVCLLRKLKPKKFLARIHFGFEDPCTTGKLLAGLSMVYPFLGKDFCVSPDFERQVLEGDLKIIGRFRVSYFARLLWKLIWCKEVRATYRHVRSFEL